MLAPLKSLFLMKNTLTSLWSVAKLVGLAASAPVQTTRLYEGHVASYPVSLTLTIADNLAYGTLLYTRSGIAIQVVGTLHGSTLLMHEFDKKGNVMGIYSGKQTSQAFLGMWNSPLATGREMPFALTSGAATKTQQLPKLADLTGTYEFNFGPKASSATLSVQQLDDHNIWVAMQGGTGEPARRLTIIDRTTLRLSGNQAIYTSAGKDQCAIKLTFFNQGVCIDFLNGSPTPGLGDTATLTGNYVRTNSQTPLFQYLN